MKKPFSFRARSFWAFGLVSGALAAFFVTLFMTLREWIENPGGIFRGAEGTNWTFVYDTAMSWLVPTFVQVAVAASAMCLVYTGLRSMLRRRRERRSGGAKA